MLYVICGSIRSSLEDMRDLELQMTQRGNLVLFPVPIPVEDNDPFADAMHLYRIEWAGAMGGEILIVPKMDGTIGVSTSREMEFAKLLGLVVRILIPATIDPENAARLLERQAELDGLAHSKTHHQVKAMMETLLAELREEIQHGSN